MRRKKRNEEGSIVTRVQGRKYLIRWTAEDGRRLSRIVKGDYVEAQAALIRELRPVNVKPERTFESFAETQFAAYIARKWKASTQITQGSFLTKHIRPFFDDMVLSRILPEHIEAFHRGLEAKKLKPQDTANDPRHTQDHVLLCG